ncbi:MAG TPA: SH3 domain-containing protein [Blastocatellia bacterium]|nr:SH3 domain-containing protein [Blastocatellia bacterium]
MKHLLALVALLLSSFSSFAQANQQWITNASGVRARASSTVNSDEVARLPIGTMLKQIGEEQRETTSGGQKDFWYHVILPTNKDGWILGRFLTRFDEARKGEIFKSIAAAKIKTESTTFSDWADLARWLATTTTGVTDRATLAELELWRWVALQKAFNNIPADKLEQPDYQRFIKANQANAVYSEPGGLWLVKPALLWNLQKKYANLPIGDTIAWEAATLPLPGECEDDDTCATNYMNETKGRYLQLYPSGKHAGEALDELIQSVQGINEQMKHVELPKGNSKQAQQIRRDALAAISKLRASVAKVTNPKKTKLLQLLAQYEKYYR